jgi:hypothetical protein
MRHWPAPVAFWFQHALTSQDAAALAGCEPAVPLAAGRGYAFRLVAEGSRPKPASVLL